MARKVRSKGAVSVIQPQQQNQCWRSFRLRRSLPLSSNFPPAIDKDAAVGLSVGWLVSSPFVRSFVPSQTDCVSVENLQFRGQSAIRTLRATRTSSLDVPLRPIGGDNEGLDCSLVILLSLAPSLHFNRGLRRVVLRVASIGVE